MNEIKLRANTTSRLSRIYGWTTSVFVLLLIPHLCTLRGATCLAGESDTNEQADDVVSRVGVALVTPSLLPAAKQKLPIAFYKNYTCFRSSDEDERRTLGYLPVLQYKQKSDSLRMRTLVQLGWHAGQIPKMPGLELSDMMDVMSLDRLEQRLLADTQSGSLPRGTLFLLGNEPGYRPNSDDRSPSEVVHDALVLRQVLNRIDADHKLALGGISTADNRFTRDAYGGKLGMEYLKAILTEAEESQFDAFVIHPYPSDPSGPMIDDVKQQILDFRRTLKEFGLHDRPLIVGEVGVPFAAARGREDQIRTFAAEIVEFCLTHRDAEIGNPDDYHRIVQQLVWYILSPPQYPFPGISDNPGLDLALSSLMTPQGELTPLGETFAATVNRLRAK